MKLSREFISGKWMNFDRISSIRYIRNLLIEGKMPFLSSMLSTQLDNLFSFFPFYKINHLLFLRYYFESISRKVLEQIKKNFQFSKFEISVYASKHTYSRNVENYVETWEKSSIRCNEFNWFNKFIIKSWDTRA